MAEFSPADIIVIHWILLTQVYFTVTFVFGNLNIKFKDFLKVDQFCDLFFLFKYFSEHFCFFFKNWDFPKHWNFLTKFSPANIIVIHWILPTQIYFTVTFVFSNLNIKLRAFLTLIIFATCFQSLKPFSEHFWYFLKIKTFFQLFSFFAASKVFPKHWKFLAKFSPADIIVIHWILLTQVYFTVTFVLGNLNIKFKDFLKVDQFCDLFFLFKYFSEHFWFFFKNWDFSFSNFLFFCINKVFCETLKFFGRIFTRQYYRDTLNFTNTSLFYCNFCFGQFKH